MRDVTIFGITLVVLGMLAAYPVVVARRPDAAVILDKIVPYQGWIGVAATLWGAWGVFDALTSLDIIGDFPLLWITFFAATAMLVLLGFLMGFSLIAKYALSKNEEAMKRGEQLRAKLVKIQTPLAFVGAGVGIWTLVYFYFIY